MRLILLKYAETFQEINLDKDSRNIEHSLPAETFQKINLVKDKNLSPDLFTNFPHVLLSTLLAQLQAAPHRCFQDTARISLKERNVPRNLSDGHILDRPLSLNIQNDRRHNHGKLNSTFTHLLKRGTQKGILEGPSSDKLQSSGTYCHVRARYGQSHLCNGGTPILTQIDHGSLVCLGHKLNRCIEVHLGWALTHPGCAWWGWGRIRPRTCTPETQCAFAHLPRQVHKPSNLAKAKIKVNTCAPIPIAQLVQWVKSAWEPHGSEVG
eukprot:Gb_24730 [translate_table: standard]